MVKHVTSVVVVVAAVSALLAGCGGSTSKDSAENGATGSSAAMSSTSVVSTSGDIVISGYAFAVPTKVAPGQKITIRNNDTVEHSVTADSGGAFDVDVDGGKTATVTAPMQAGSYAFHCDFHPRMSGTLTVA